MSVGASDIHVEPQQRVASALPSRLIPAVTSRFKILADLDIAELDFRVHPAQSLEKVCPQRPNWGWTS